ncbi:hypothetical protein [Halorubrum sp. SD683]|uniref:hypothetical protein n=1 Tax=Halorubrum sp. SD683 TaxID=1855873 RepID=UPI000A2EA289|nr:hypothetical protein [Halorubrum sp. SD683]OTF01716.1 hypothetical protein B9G49_00180 [Halorubrum sp. SD683]
MTTSPRDLLLGERFQRNLDFLGAAVLLVGSFVAYATGLFAVEGGVIVLPSDATAVGLIAAGWIGYGRGALLPAWASLFAAYLGFHADWAFLGLSSHSLPGKLAFLFDPVTLAVYVAASILLGSAAFGVGYLLSVGVGRLRGSSFEA